ncbi:uncharacterized protein LOC108226198 isoform X1 [Daucus carota subsp. sativus]|uniref:uncharacterized protein LOC108226198 isoform X1 n=1 Tax=Daucus carota subsp. sativus TaxID=79200 RepID=UPI0030834AEF
MDVSMFNKYDKVQHLHTERTEWTLRVRAQALWKSINRQTKEFRGLNVIFIDDSNWRIHAFVSAKICVFFEDLLKEGAIYTLSNFHVREYGTEENNRAVRFGKHIYFANHTQLVPEVDNITNIAPYAFDLFQIADATNLITDTRFLIDVVGKLEDKNIQPVQSKDDEKRIHIRFKISDGRSSINVTFFGELALEFDKSVKVIKDENISVIISSAKVNHYDGSICLNNYPATRFYINPNHHSVAKLIERISDPAYCVNTFEHVTEETPPLFSVEDIKKLQMDYVERKVRCKITVKKVDEKSNWYDDVCSTCGTEVTTVDGRYRCVICSRNVPFPDKRFRIATLCNDTTGLIAIVFPDDEIQRIIGKNAFELEDEVGDENKFPSLLKGFEKKDYVITLTITERNVKKTSNIYTATEISDPVEVLGNHSPTKEAEVTTGEEPVVNLGMSPRVDNSDNVTATEIPCSLTAKTSPPTANSSNKSRSREKKKDVEYELEDDVPIGKFKIPKTEKFGRLSLESFFCCVLLLLFCCLMNAVCKLYTPF